jgi:hypothetical protein
MARAATAKNPDRLSDFSDYDRRKMILAVILSSHKPGTFFNSRTQRGMLSNSLDQQIRFMLCGEKHPLITEHFHFETGGSSGLPYCEDLDFLMVRCAFGEPIGLRNWGMDYDYEVTKKTADIAEGARRYFDSKEFEYLRDLGRKLKTRT